MAVNVPTIADTPDLTHSDNFDAVRAELSRLFEHKLFKDTTRMKRFLGYIVEEAIQGRADRLKGYTIGLEVFDRPESFDPQADTIVRVQAGQLRRRLDLYYADAGKTSPVRILVPKGRYAPIFEFRQQAPLTEDKKADELVPVAANDPRPSIAVLSLDDLTLPGEGAYFAAGLTAEIVNALVQFRGLRVVTLTPTVASRLNAITTRETGQRAGADFVLSGNVRRDGEIFRVMLNLIRAETGEHIFSRIYDREFTPGSLFSLQEEIASYTAASIAAPFGAVNRYNRRMQSGRKNSPDAVKAALSYHNLRLSPTRSGAEELLEDFKRITDKEDRFSTGWAMRALLNTFLVSQTFPIRDAKAHLEDAEKAGKMAVKIDSENALGHFSLYMTHYLRGEFDHAAENIERALSLNPNDYWMLAYYGVGLAMRGEVRRAINMQEAAKKLVGHAPVWFHMPQAIQDYLTGDYDAVIAWLPEDTILAPQFVQLLGVASLALSGRKDSVDALVKAMKAETPNLEAEIGQSFLYWHMHPALNDKLIAGLAAAGLDIMPPSAPT
jgi:TolB-like protein